jgi:hypothetical protein
MQNFQLISLQTNEPVSLSLVDEQICNNVLHVPVHPKNYGGPWDHPKSFNWFDTIGFQIACGKPLQSDDLLNHYRTSEIWKDELEVITEIIYFLRKSYKSTAWYSVREHA